MTNDRSDGDGDLLDELTDEKPGSGGQERRPTRRMRVLLFILGACVILAAFTILGMKGMIPRPAPELVCTALVGKVVEANTGWGIGKRWCVTRIPLTTDGGDACESWVDDKTCQGVCYGFWGDVDMGGMLGGSTGPDGQCSKGRLLFEIKK